MTTDLVETCAIAASLADNSHNGEPFAANWRKIVLAVIDALADGVSDEMVAEAKFTYMQMQHWPSALSAAIRAAKSREG